MTTVDRPNDPLGAAIRATLGGVPVRIGAIVGAGMFLFAGLFIFLITVLPSWTIQIMLQVRNGAGDHVTVSHRIVSSFTGAWGIAIDVDTHSGTLSLKGFATWPTLVGITAIVLGGIYVRRIHNRLRDRLIALVTSALVLGVLVAITCLLFSYSVAGNDFSHPAGGSFLVAFVMVTVIGLFSFGVVAALSEPARTVIRNGGIAFAVVFGIAAVVAGLALAFGPATVKTGGSGGYEAPAEQHLDAFNGGLAVAAGALPLATLADASFNSGDESFSPLEESSANNNGAVRVVWPGFNTYSLSHKTARLTDVANEGGTFAKILLYGAAAGVVIVWIFAALITVRRLGAPRSWEGLVLGALVGVVGGVLQLVAGALATETVSFTSSKSFSGGELVRWGSTGEASFQTLAVLALLCGVTGLLYAAFRPSDRRYAAVQLTAPQWMTPPPNRPATSAPSAPEPADSSAMVPLPSTSPATPQTPPVVAAGQEPEPAHTIPAPPPAASPTHATPESAEETPTFVAPGEVAPESPVAPAHGETAAQEMRFKPFCTSCGTPFENDSARFCAECGAARQPATS